MSEFWFIIYVNDGGDGENNRKQFTEKTAACVQNAVDAWPFLREPANSNTCNTEVKQNVHSV